MFPRTSTLLFLLLLAAAPAARPDAGPVLSADTGWQRLDEKDGVTLFSRARPGVDFKEFKATGQIDAPPSVVEQVLADVSAYPDFMPFVSESRVIGRDGADTLTYQRLSIPFVAGRDYTVRVEHGTTQIPGGQTLYRDIWQTANEAGPPEHRGTVRVKVNEGSWLLQPSGPAGLLTQASYQIYTDSGGVLPAFLANHASLLIIPKVFNAVRKQTRNPKYLQPVPPPATTASSQ